MHHQEVMIVYLHRHFAAMFTDDHVSPTRDSFVRNNISANVPQPSSAAVVHALLSSQLITRDLGIVNDSKMTEGGTRALTHLKINSVVR
jgi:hypothetical protein